MVGISNEIKENPLSSSTTNTTEKQTTRPASNNSCAEHKKWRKVVMKWAQPSNCLGLLKLITIHTTFIILIHSCFHHNGRSTIGPRCHRFNLDIHTRFLQFCLRDPSKSLQLEHWHKDWGSAFIVYSLSLCGVFTSPDSIFSLVFYLQLAAAVDKDLRLCHMLLGINSQDKSGKQKI